MPRNFTPAEVYGLDKELVRMLDDARDLAKTPFVISSGLRKGDPLSHGLEPAKGVDLKCSRRASVKRMKMYDALRAVGFVRIGVYDGHLHADIAKKIESVTIPGSSRKKWKRFPQNVMWWGKSK